MKNAAVSSALFLGLVHLASSHYVFSKVIVGGTKSKDFEYVRKNSNNYMPTKGTSILADDFRCNSDSFASAANTKVMEVAAGTEVSFELAYDATMKHPGPLQVYMSKAPGKVQEYEGDGEWFKIHQERLCADASAGLKDEDWCTWGNDTATFTIPASVPEGEYLIRPEHIALHGAHDGGAEFYYSCGQFKVTGGGSAKPSPAVKIPGVYAVSDGAINFNIWNHPTSYDFMPGPAVWLGAGGGSPSPPVSLGNSTAAPMPTGGEQSASGVPGTASSAAPGMLGTDTAASPGATAAPLPPGSFGAAKAALADAPVDSPIPTSITSAVPSTLTTTTRAAGGFTKSFPWPEEIGWGRAARYA